MLLRRLEPRTRSKVFLEYRNEGQLSGPPFPTVTIPPGENGDGACDATRPLHCYASWRKMQQQHWTLACVDGGGAKCQQYTKKRGGVGNPITSASSFTGQRETDSQELWETNEISESWVRRLPLEVRQGGKPEVWVEKWRAKYTSNIFFVPTGQGNWTKRKSNHSPCETATAREEAVGGDGDISMAMQRQISTKKVLDCFFWFTPLCIYTLCQFL